MMPPFVAPPDLEGASSHTRWGDHRHLAAILNVASKVTFLTGAGLSAPSGIPTYRGRGGKWTVMDPIRHDQFVGDATLRAEQWRRVLSDHAAFSAARPNAGHEAIARLARSREVFVATQNVDGLHAADLGYGLSELHGNARRVRCLSCSAAAAFDAVRIAACLAARESPRCQACGGLEKPDIVMFGGDLDADVHVRAVKAAEACIAFVAVGTSLRVHPAAGLLEDAVENGAVVVIVNDGITPYHGAAHLLVGGNASEALALAVPG